MNDIYLTEYFYNVGLYFIKKKTNNSPFIFNYLFENLKKNKKMYVFIIYISTVFDKI